MSDLDTIRERHFPVAPKPDKGGEPDVCLTCDEDWPCDTRVVLDVWPNPHTVDRLENALEASSEGYHAARTDANRLAEALRGTLALAEMYHNDLRHHSHEPGDPAHLTDEQVEGVPAGTMLTRKACSMCVTIVAAREAIEREAREPTDDGFWADVDTLVSALLSDKVTDIILHGPWRTPDLAAAIIQAAKKEAERE